MSVYNCNGISIDLSSPKVMGIINITPDSFYKKSRVEDIIGIVKKVEDFLEEGASIIDLGAISSRPGASDLDVHTEQERLFPVFKELRKIFPNTIFSIDTFRASIAEELVGMGANMINDISSGDRDELMLELVSKLPVPYIMMHMRGTSSNMQNLVNYDNLILDVMSYFTKKITRLQYLGKHDLIIDPGFGFAKTLMDNYKLLKMLEVFNVYNLPVLVGVSRKSMIYNLLNISAEETLAATTALHLQALMNGAKILRVHDVKEATQATQLYEVLKA